MPKILFLTVHRPDRSPSQRFRFEQYLNHLKNNGYEYDFSFLINSDDDKIFYSKGNFVGKTIIVLKSFCKRLIEVLNAGNYDIVFIQRESIMLGTSFFEMIFSKSNAKLVFDFDDSIWLQNVSEGNKSFAWLKNADKTSDIIRYSDLIFAGNKYLYDFAKKYNSNVTIVPTTIDTNEYIKIAQQKNNEKICIGWSGSITTIQHFEYALPFLKKIKEKFGESVYFKVIGDGKYKNIELDINGLAWKKEEEIKELSSFDIGIMPLPDDEWAKGKCGLKGLQYMALEVPTIMSPVGVNNDIISDGENGFLAFTENQWIEKIELLINNASLREKIGKAGRQTVVEKYSIEAWKYKYVDLFNYLLK